MNINTDIDIALLNKHLKWPPILYKYLSDRRVEDVLEDGSLRFTPLSNTNDPFEVSQTFKRLAGPEYRQEFREKLQESSKSDFFKIISKQNNDEWKKCGVILSQEELRQLTEKSLKTIEKNHMISLNSEFYIKMFLKDMAEMLCFSLSQQADISPMWAHYANQGKGFVVAFDTTSIWFKKWRNGETKRLLKVNYFDDQIEEAFDDPSEVLISKGKDWEYEREWRTYATEDQVDRIEGTTEEPIHLMNFPPDAIQRIILGAKINPEVESKIKEIACAKYPHAEIYRMRSNPLKSRMEEVKV